MSRYQAEEQIGAERKDKPVSEPEPETGCEKTGAEPESETGGGKARAENEVGIVGIKVDG